MILKPALGSFCTLDPLGYDYKQMDVMFMTLGSMIGQLRKGGAGEHQLRLLFALLRTCAGMSTFYVVSSCRSWDSNLCPCLFNHHLLDLILLTSILHSVLVVYHNFYVFAHPKCFCEHFKMSLVMRKPAFCICKNKDADQLRSNREADQRLCFCYTDSTIPLLPKSEILSF